MPWNSGMSNSRMPRACMVRSACAAWGPSRISRRPFHRNGPFRDVHIEYRESVREAIFRILRQPVAMRRDQGKDAKNTLPDR